MKTLNTRKTQAAGKHLKRSLRALLQKEKTRERERQRERERERNNEHDVLLFFLLRNS